MEDRPKSGDESNVFYCKPETFLLQDPEYQRQYREQTLKKVAGVPKPEPISFLGDELYRTFVMTVADRSSPDKMK